MSGAAACDVIGPEVLAHLHQSLSAIRKTWSAYLTDITSASPDQPSTKEAKSAAHRSASWEVLNRHAERNRIVHERVVELLQHEPASWRELLKSDPESMTADFINTLAHHAERAREWNDPARARDIAQFAVLCGTEVAATTGLLEWNVALGRAWLQLAEAQYALHDIEAALDADDRALALLRNELHAQDEAHAQMLRARLWMEKGGRASPVLLLCNCARLFTVWLNPAAAIEALSLVMELLCRVHLWTEVDDLVAAIHLLASEDDDSAELRMPLERALNRCAEHGYQRSSGAVQ